jgi:hypothetical protein
VIGSPLPNVPKTFASTEGREYTVTSEFATPMHGTEGVAVAGGA